MADPSFIKELPMAIQIAINLGILIVTIVVGLKSYYAGKKTTDVPKTDVIFTGANTKFLEEVQENFESMAEDITRIADAVEAINKTIAESARSAEIDREVRRITGERKRGSGRETQKELDKIIEKI